MSPTSTRKWSRHPVYFECVLSLWAALSPYFFNIRQSIQRTPKIRLPLSRIWNIPSFLVFAGVQSPCKAASSMLQPCRLPCFQGTRKVLFFGSSSHLKPYFPSLIFCTSQSRNRSLFLWCQASVDSGRVPSKWKHANVCSVYKNGGKSNPANYRPISLTCIASKVLEHIIHSHIMKHLEQYSILTDVQHGFRAKRSTVTQLILTIHDMAKTIQDNKSVHAAVLDFSKAFHCVKWSV